MKGKTRQKAKDNETDEREKKERKKRQSKERSVDQGIYEKEGGNHSVGIGFPARELGIIVREREELPFFAGDTYIGKDDGTDTDHHIE